MKEIKFSKENIENIILRYNNGYSINIISKELDVDNTVIKRILIQNGVKIRTIKEGHNTSIYNKIYKDSIIKKYGVDNISKCNIVKQKKINTIMNRFGVKNPYQISSIRNKAIASQNSFKFKELMSKRMSGENNPQWQGGITSESKRLRNNLDTQLWREFVFKRDNWTCQKCLKRGFNIQAHHIKNFIQYPKLRYVFENGITLCNKDHREFHKKYGIKNNNVNQIKEFLGDNNV